MDVDKRLLIIRGEAWRQRKFEILGEERAKGARAALDLLKNLLPEIHESHQELALKGICTYWNWQDTKDSRPKARQSKRLVSQFVAAINRAIEAWDNMHPDVQNAVREKVLFESESLEITDTIDDCVFLSEYLENPEEWLNFQDPRRDSGRIALTKTMATVWEQTTGSPVLNEPAFSKFLVDLYKLIGVEKWPDTIEREAKNDLHGRVARTKKLITYHEN